MGIFEFSESPLASENRRIAWFLAFAWIMIGSAIGYRMVVDSLEKSREETDRVASVALHVARYSATESVRRIALAHVDETFRVQNVAYHVSLKRIFDSSCGSATVLSHEVHDDRTGLVRCGSPISHVVIVQRDLAGLPYEPDYDNDWRRYQKLHPSEIDAMEMQKP